MSARMFISLMFLLMVFTAGLFVFATPARKSQDNKDCPAGPAYINDIQGADGMIWESVSRPLLNVIQ